MLRAFKAHDFESFSALHITTKEAQELGVKVSDAEDARHGVRAIWADQFNMFLEMDGVDWKTAEFDRVESKPMREGHGGVIVTALIKSDAGFVWMEIVAQWFNERWIVGQLDFRYPWAWGLRVNSPSLTSIGLLDGDVIYSIDGEQIESQQGAVELWNRALKQAETSLTIERGGQGQTLRVDMETLARLLEQGGGRVEPIALR